MNLIIKTEQTGITENEIAALRPKASEALDRLWSGQEPMTGWVKLPIDVRNDDLEYILNLADMIKGEAELFVVIGIGGSYTGAKATIEALPKYEQGVPIRFLGNNLCSDYYTEILEEIKNKKTIACVISKSGNTIEVRAAFEIIKPLLVAKYGSETEAAKRIIVITDEDNDSSKAENTLESEAKLKGYTILTIPSDVGGRYSVMTAVGLLPMAVSGIDIREFLRGGAECANSPEWDLTATDYAICRHLLQKQGKEVEFIELCHSRLNGLGEWMKQLYGESEGKEGKGLMPATLTFSTDLHSVGQYLQEGRQIFMETLLVVDKPYKEIEIPAGQLEGKTVSDLSRAMVMGVVRAHRKASIPIVEIHLPQLEPFEFGQLMYFLETSCAVTAMLSDVNPFDQPGVEAYKSEMHKLLD